MSVCNHKASGPICFCNPEKFCLVVINRPANPVDILCRRSTPQMAPLVKHQYQYIDPVT